MNKWALFKNKDKDIVEINAWVSACDATLGFPESLSSLTNIGAGIHCELSRGRATHFSTPEPAKDGKRLGYHVANQHKDQLSVSSELADEAEILPEDWEDEDEQ